MIYREGCDATTRIGIAGWDKMVSRLYLCNILLLKVDALIPNPHLMDTTSLNVSSLLGTTCRAFATGLFR